MYIYLLICKILSLYSLLQDDTRNTTRKRNTCIVIKRIEIQQQQASSSSLVIEQAFLLAHRQLRIISRQIHIFMCPLICALRKLHLWRPGKLPWKTFTGIKCAIRCVCTFTREQSGTQHRRRRMFREDSMCRGPLNCQQQCRRPKGRPAVGTSFARYPFHSFT